MLSPPSLLTKTRNEMYDARTMSVPCPSYPYDVRTMSRGMSVVCPWYVRGMSVVRPWYVRGMSSASGHTKRPPLARVTRVRAEH